MSDTVIGVIGGSGIYEIDGLDGAEWLTVDSPWGKPSDQILTGTLDGVKMAFLPRHGRGHVHSPTTVPYRANIDALKRAGCTDILAISAVGSLREQIERLEAELAEARAELDALESRHADLEGALTALERSRQDALGRQERAESRIFKAQADQADAELRLIDEQIKRADFEQLQRVLERLVGKLGELMLDRAQFATG